MNHKLPFFNFLAAIGVLFCLLASSPAAETNAPEAFSKKAMLHDIAARVIAPGYQELASKCHQLTNAIGELTKTPGETAMDNARKSWVDVLIAASHLRCYQAGPVADRNFGSAFYYWQIVPQKIESPLDSSNAIDSSLLDELGSNAKGLFALEYLLYTPKNTQPDGKSSTPLELISGDTGKRRREFIVLLAHDLDAKASQLAKDWTALGDKEASSKFAESGQESVNLMVNQMAMALEDATEHRLRFALALRSPIAPQIGRIESGRSGSSLQSLIATLQGARELYRGGEGLGLDDALKRINPTLEKRVEEQFDATIAAIKNVNLPLEQAVITNRPPVQTALEKTRALEVLVKVDVLSALGVTLTFSSVDGD